MNAFKRWVVVLDGGLATERVDSEFDTFLLARGRYLVLIRHGRTADILVRDASGSLSTEY